MADDMPPDWAIERALTLGFTGTRLEDIKRHSSGHTAYIAFARYIAAHEEPPVDPLREIVSEIVDEVSHSAASLTTGHFADRFMASLAERGLEIREVQP